MHVSQKLDEHNCDTCYVEGATMPIDPHGKRNADNGLRVQQGHDPTRHIDPSIGAGLRKLDERISDSPYTNRQGGRADDHTRKDADMPATIDTRNETHIYSAGVYTDPQKIMRVSSIRSVITSSRTLSLRRCPADIGKEQRMQRLGLLR